MQSSILGHISCHAKQTKLPWLKLNQNIMDFLNECLFFLVIKLKTIDQKIMQHKVAHCGASFISMLIHVQDNEKYVTSRQEIELTKPCEIIMPQQDTEPVVQSKFKQQRILP